MHVVTGREKGGQVVAGSRQVVAHNKYYYNKPPQQVLLQGDGETPVVLLY